MNKYLIFTIVGSLAFSASTYAGARERNELPKIDNFKKQTPTAAGVYVGEMKIDGTTFHIMAPQSKKRAIATRNARTTPVIYDAPGEVQRYCKDAVGYAQSQPFQSYAIASEINWDGNDAYFLNVITGAPMGTYVKGSLEGNQIVLPMNQTVMEFEDEDYDMNLGLLRPILTPVTDSDGDSDIIVWFEYCDDYDHVTYTKDENGTWMLQSPKAKYEYGEINPSQYNFPDYVIGYYYTDEYDWAFFCDVFQAYDEFNYLPVEMPSGLPEQKFTYINLEGMGVIVTCYEDTDAIYLKGLSAYLPDAVVKADIVENGSKISVAPYQFIGIEAGIYYVITNTAHINNGEIEWIEDDTPVYFNLERDSEGKILSISSEGTNFLVFNDDPFFFWPFDVFMNFKMSLQESFAGTPSTPYKLEYAPYGDWMGANYIFFKLSPFANNGDIIDVNNLFYSVYINGDPVLFEEETALDLMDEEVVMYRGISEPTYLIPYTFANDVDLYEDSGKTFIVGLYSDGIDNVSVQAVYKYGDTTTYSDMVTVNANDAKVESLSPAEIVDDEFFNLNGVRVTNPGEGIYIKVSKLSDGSIKATKIAIGK